jgi:hypothetical protein
MVKYFTEDAVVPKELEHFVRPVKTDTMQRSISDKQQPIHDVCNPSQERRDRIAPRREVYLDGYYR